MDLLTYLLSGFKNVVLLAPARWRGNVFSGICLYIIIIIIIIIIIYYVNRTKVHEK